MAFARVAPPSTVVRTPVRVFWKAGFSWLAARISRHCTKGRPASIMTENCRKKMAMSLVLTFPEPNVERELFPLLPNGACGDPLTAQLGYQHLLVYCDPLPGNLLAGCVLT